MNNYLFYPFLPSPSMTVKVKNTRIIMESKLQEFPSQPGRNIPTPKTSFFGEQFQYSLKFSQQKLTTIEHQNVENMLYPTRFGKIMSNLIDTLNQPSRTKVSTIQAQATRWIDWTLAASVPDSQKRYMWFLWGGCQGTNVGQFMYKIEILKKYI